MWCESDNHNDMCHICEKELLDSIFSSYEAVMLFTKYQFLTKLPKFHIFPKIIFFEV